MIAALCVLGVLCGFAAVVPAHGAADTRVDMPALLARIAERVEAYYSRAQSVLCIEKVRLQPLKLDFTPDGFGRQLVYELRVSWDAATDGVSPPEPNVLRRLREVNGREPKPGDEPECLDPKPVSLDPLSFLLARHQREYVFTYKGAGRANGRDAVMIDWKPAEARPAEITWKDTCVSIDLPARSTGRVFVDPASGDVLRLDEHVRGPFDIKVPREAQRGGGPFSLVFERADQTIEYKAVVFHDPDETLMLPDSIELISVFLGGGAPRLRTVQSFSGYQRFVTDAKIVR